MLSLPEHFAKQLTKRLDEFHVNELQLWELPPEIAAWYYAGWSEARAQAKAEARVYEQRLDLAYIQMVHPKERAQEIQRRMNTHFEREEAAFFAAAEVESVSDHRTQRPDTGTQKSIRDNHRAA